MPLDQSEAIILRTENFGEQDKLVVFFSREKGLVRGLAKGARKFNNRFGSSLEPFSQVRLFYYEKEKHDFVTISNSDLIDSAFELFSQLKTSWAFAYLAELTEKFSPYREKEELLYRLLQAVRSAAKAGQPVEYITRYFEFWFLKINGILPDFNRCQHCQRPINASSWLAPERQGVLCPACASDQKLEVTPVARRLIDWMKKNSPLTTPDFVLTPQDWKNLGKVFQAIIIFHLEERPRTLDYLDF
ncbi:MAG TPA: DNA repair protein RecO [Candidatus Saccharicenans sp.]|nr:DNA repair protein RecO [Candidatus Saccharicenans sp.]HPU94122.1 DNA repair protein RecO [Candidatus Saccharicenans sp.]